MNKLLQKLEDVTTYRKKEVDELLQSPETWRIARLVVDRLKDTLHNEMAYYSHLVDAEGRETDAVDFAFGLEDTMADEYYAITGRHYIGPNSRAVDHCNRLKRERRDE